MKYITHLLAAIIIMTTASLSHAQKKDGKVLRHVVLFKFKDSSSAEEVKKLEKLKPFSHSKS